MEIEQTGITITVWVTGPFQYGIEPNPKSHKTTKVHGRAQQKQLLAWHGRVYDLHETAATTQIHENITSVTLVEFPILTSYLTTAKGCPMNRLNHKPKKGYLMILKDMLY